MQPQPDRRPASLGDRLDVVAAVCGVATFVVLGTALVAGLVATLPVGAVPEPWQQRILLTTQGIGVGLAAVIVVGAAALSLRRWLGGDDAVLEERITLLVRSAAIGVVAFAVVGTVADVLWRTDATYFRLRLIGEGAATAALGALAAWLAGPARG